jgi:hypothetical protein
MSLDYQFLYTGSSFVLRRRQYPTAAHKSLGYSGEDRESHHQAKPPFHTFAFK